MLDNNQGPFGGAFMRACRSALASIGRTLTRLLGTIGIWLIALVLLFEEWGWVQLAAILAWFGRLPGLRWIEGRIRRLPPYAALGLFAIPLITLLPLKLLALYWLGHGHTALGIGVIISAKLVGTGITARLFMLTQPTLMRLPWFARLFHRWMAFKDKVLGRVKNSRAWTQWLVFKAAARQQFQRLTRHIRQWWRR
jgi:hypothetical protein